MCTNIFRMKLIELLVTWQESSGGDSAEAATPVVDESLLYCPKCSKSFTQLRPLEEHVNKCLDED